MIGNKLGDINKDIIVKPRKCKQCDVLLNKENMFRYSSYAGYSKICTICRNKNNLKYSRKKTAAIKANPLW